MSRTTIYEQLGVRTIINAAGTFTRFGGSIMPPAVTQAWLEASKSFVDLDELQRQVGRRIANLLGVESALVTGGAASSILLGTAASITIYDPDFISGQPDATGAPYEVLRLRTQRDLYDRQIETCGVNIVEASSVADAQQKISERTVMMMSYNVYEPGGPVSHERWLELAADAQIPALLDAAADVPPVSNLSRFTQMGYDMVAFSGGKAIRGPQTSGLLLGRAKLIDAARENATPNEGTIGRVSKISKEDIVALWKAVELFVESGDGIGGHCMRKLHTIRDIVEDIPSLQWELITPPVANRFPHLLLVWDVERLAISYKDMRRELWEGEPQIATDRVYGTGSDGLLISAINLQRGEEQIVGERIRQVLEFPNR